MTILFIAPTDPASETSGSEQRTAALYRSLTKLGTVYTVIPVKRPKREFLDEERRVQGICPLPPKHWGKCLVRSLLKRVSTHMRPAFAVKGVHERVFPGVRFDVVVVRYLQVAAEMRAWEFGPCHVDVDDLPLEQYETGAAPHHTALRRALTRMLLQRWTTAIAAHCASLWVASARHRSRFPSIRTTLLPNIARPVPEDYPYDHPRAQRLLTVGLMSYTPNHMGVDRFLAEVWPALHAAYPELTYRVVGRGAPEGYVARWSALPGVEVAGFVDGLHAEYASALACVAPIDSGSGTCIKTIEALFHGRCCLATPFAARGWPDDCFDGTNGLAVYHTAEDFIARFASLVANADVRKRCEEAGRRYAAKHFSAEEFCANVRRGLFGDVHE